MRTHFVMTLLAVLFFLSGSALASPPIAISVEDLQLLQTEAVRSNADAQNNLRFLYRKAQGDYVKDKEWYEKAAAHKHPTAQSNLGWLYANRRGIPQDYVRAYMWRNLAATHSTGKEESVLDRVSHRMTPGQIAEDQRLLQQCQAQQFVGC